MLVMFRAKSCVSEEVTSAQEIIQKMAKRLCHVDLLRERMQLGVEFCEWREKPTNCFSSR